MKVLLINSDSGPDYLADFVNYYFISNRNEVFTNHRLDFLFNDFKNIPENASQGWEKGRLNVRRGRIGILKKGGNAVDAAVAVGFALAVTLPRAGNLGGGGFILIYEKETQKVSSIDYRSAAPVAAKSEMFISDNKVQRFGHLVNAVPGSVLKLHL